jgi:hypothetical protein
MIDSRHRLRPERIVNGRASLFKDLKALFINVWKGLFYVFCCMQFRNKKKKNDYDIDNEPVNEEDEQQRRPLLDE